jgi:hypothetical protein
VKPPKSNKRLDAAGRKEKAIRGDLDHIDSLLESTKAQGGRGFGDCWPYPLATDAKIKKDKRQRTIVERPSTPVVSPFPVNNAIILLTFSSFVCDAGWRERSCCCCWLDCS